MQLAEVEVLEVLQGNYERNKLFYTDDSRTPLTGEKALLFLDPGLFDFSEKYWKFNRKVNEILGDYPLLSSSTGYSGVMPIIEVDGVEHAAVDTRAITWPEYMKITHDNGHNLVKLDEILEYIKVYRVSRYIHQEEKKKVGSGE